MRTDLDHSRQDAGQTTTSRRIGPGALTALAALFAMLLGACAMAPAGSNAAVAPPEVTSNRAAGWPLPGHDYGNSRDAAGSAIRSSSVARLTPAWKAGTPGALTTAVVIVGTTVYAEDDLGVVISVDGQTGRVLWRSPPTGFTVGPEGVVAGWGRVYATTNDGVEALDAASGRLLWVRRLASGTDGVDVQPTVAGRLVLAATVPVTAAVQYGGGDRGVLYALDSTTGAVRWSFDTVDSKDLWGNPGVNSGGGAWYPPSVDLRNGIVYWGTANPAPFPGTPAYPNGSSRPGPNLYTDCTVALKLSSGRLVWYHQATPHDLFDRDFVNTMLVPTRSGPEPAVVVGAGKGGEVLGMDPSSGHVLWRTQVGLHENDQLKSLPGPTEVLPGTYGGVLTPPASADGTVYVATLNAPDILVPDHTAYFGGKTGTMDGEVVAMDAASGKVRWDTKVSGDPTGAATVVNDLVLTATLQGSVVALNRYSGRIVWQSRVGSAVSGSLAVDRGLLVVPTGAIGSHGELVALRL